MFWCDVTITDLSYIFIFTMLVARAGLLLCVFSELFILSSGQINTYSSVPDLERTMYTTVGGYPCVRLLNISGEIGCTNPGHTKVTAPIRSFRNSKTLPENSTVLLSVTEISPFFTSVSKDPAYARNVAGVLVESGADIHTLKGFSPDRKFPQPGFAPYNNTSYTWNPVGSAIMWNAYEFPVFLLTKKGTSLAQKAAEINENREKTLSRRVAEFDLIMQTTISGTHNSESCLKEATCLPLGGYSVWASLPPLNLSSPSEKPKSIILAVASMDSASLFRGKSPGADSPISGLISLLAAVDALSKVNDLSTSSRQIVFMVFTGEAWGYLGSRRFLAELDQRTDSVHGLDGASIEMVIEIGSVGKVGLKGRNKTFFAHATANGIFEAFRTASDSLGSENINVHMANAANPGIPPSSLMAFLKKNPQTTGAVLEDFDNAFSNNVYHSHLDGVSNINCSAITAAATLVARVLYLLSKNSSSISQLALINANASLVEELVVCLLQCDPGLSCSLVGNYISPRSVCPDHYVGVLVEEPSSTPRPEYVGDVSRFAWNFLAERTAILDENRNFSCPGQCSKEGGLCVGSETDGVGRCVFSTTRYVPAYSTRIKFVADRWTILPENSDDVMEMADPVWTESNWESIGLRFYTVQDQFYDSLVLLGGISLTVVAYVCVEVTKIGISKAMKLD